MNKVKWMKGYAKNKLIGPALKLSKRLFKVSFSQSGEDIIIKNIFDAFEIKHPSYIDVGAYDPYHFSNTALFHLMGSRGINIEPDPDRFVNFLGPRREDINLNIGVALDAGMAKLYIMSVPTLNTFSRSTAEELVTQTKVSVVHQRMIRMDTISNVIEKHSNGKFPDFLSLDVEGLELEILSSIDYDKSKPVVICVETISYSESGKGVKDQSVAQFLADKGYMIYADTHVNTIFVENDKWVRT